MLKITDKESYIAAKTLACKVKLNQVIDTAISSLVTLNGNQFSKEIEELKAIQNSFVVNLETGDALYQILRKMEHKFDKNKNVFVLSSFILPGLRSVINTISKIVILQSSESKEESIEIPPEIEIPSIVSPD